MDVLTKARRINIFFLKFDEKLALFSPVVLYNVNILVPMLI